MVPARQAAAPPAAGSGPGPPRARHPLPRPAPGGDGAAPRRARRPARGLLTPAVPHARRARPGARSHPGRALSMPPPARRPPLRGSSYRSSSWSAVVAGSYCAWMRYLAEPLIIGALRRGRSVEQFLGSVGSPERPGVRYAEVRTARTSYEVYVHAVEDVGHESFLDLDVFSSWARLRTRRTRWFLPRSARELFAGDGSTRVSCRTSTATSSGPAARPACRRTGIPGLTCAPGHADVIDSFRWPLPGPGCRWL